MRKVFLVMLEDGTCAFSRVPGDAYGMRRTYHYKKKTQEPKSDAARTMSSGENTTDASPPSA